MLLSRPYFVDGGRGKAVREKESSQEISTRRIVAAARGMYPSFERLRLELLVRRRPALLSVCVQPLLPVTFAPVSPQ